jgi:KTSC domain-containing protein
MARNYAAEYQRRQERARGLGFTGYSHRRRYGLTARSSDMGMSGPDLDTTSVRRRVREAVATFPEGADDWDTSFFDSTRVASARYSRSRQQLVVHWTNAPEGVPYAPYIYDAVPPAVWTGFRSAGSAGRFVNTTLNTFPYRPAPEEI